MSAQTSSLIDKQGISKRFLDYMRGLDTTVGQKALGSDQTVSGKVQSTLKGARTRAKTIDEQKGYSKIAHEVGRTIFVRIILTPAITVLLKGDLISLWKVCPRLLH
jgi:hypothetical protein